MQAVSHFMMLSQGRDALCLGPPEMGRLTDRWHRAPPDSIPPSRFELLFLD